MFPKIWARDVGHCRPHGGSQPCSPLKQQDGVRKMGKRFAWASIVYTLISYVGAFYPIINFFRNADQISDQYFLFLRLALDLIMMPVKLTKYEDSLDTAGAHFQRARRYRLNDHRGTTKC